MRPLQVADAETIVLGLQDEIRRSEESRYDHRLHGVLLVAQGMTCPEVSRMLGDAPRSVEYWVRRFEERGLGGLVEGYFFSSRRRHTRSVSAFLLNRSSDLLMLGSVLVLMLPLLVWLTPDLRIKKSLLKCNWTIRKRLPRCKMRLKKRLLAFSRRLHARIRKTRYMHKMRCLLINRRSLLLALRLLWKTPIFPSNSRFPRLCAKC